MIEFAIPTREHVDSLAPRLREMDQREVEYSAGLTPEGALLSSLYASDIAWTILVDGVPEAMCGCTGHQINPAIGIPWFLASDVASHHKISMIRKGSEWIDQMHCFYPVLSNAVYEGHQESRKFVEALGFQPAQTLENYGVSERTFVLYVKKRDV